MTTEGCHLCDEALAMLLAMEPLAGCWLEAVDVADSDALMERYGERIPVVRVPENGAEIDWPFSERDVMDWLQSTGR